MKLAIRPYALVFIFSTLFTEPVIAVTFSDIDYVVGSSPFAISTGDINKDGELKKVGAFFLVLW